MTEEKKLDDHDAWTERLSEHVDGTLSAGDAGEVERHLEECAACRDVAADLRAIRDAASRLPDVPPGRDLWPGIRRAIGGAEVAPLDRQGHPTVPAGRRRRGLFLSYAQLAAAAAGLLLVGGTTTWALAGGSGPRARSAGPGPATAVATDPSGGSSTVPGAATGPGARVTASYAAEAERLESLLESSRDLLEPRTVRVLEKNLAVIDRAIAESVAALEADPDNGWVREHLRRSWERKIDYLREASDLLGWSEAD